MHLYTLHTCRKALTALRATGHNPQPYYVWGIGIGPAVLAGIVAQHGVAVN